MTLSNKPWICLSFTLTLILGIILTILVCLLLLIDPILPNYTQQYTESEVRNLYQFPIPKVVMMHKTGQGHLFTLKQNPNLSFELDWSFKLPRTGPPNPYDIFNDYDVGHFLFEDQSQIYAIPSNMNQKMTVLQPPTKKHFTIKNSQIPAQFYISGHLVRAGDFIMIFGGYSMYSGNLFTCSSSKKIGLFGDPEPSTAIWSIRKRIWIKGPYLPGRVGKCFLDATGFAINRTHAVLLVVSQDHYSIISNAETRCIQADVFSFQTMTWVDMNDCLIDLGVVIYKVGNDKIALASTTFFNKQGKLMVIINFNSFYGYEIQDLSKFKMYLLDYHSKEVHEVGDVFPFQSMFTLKNVIYIPLFPSEATDSCHSFYTGECVEKIQIFSLIENGTSNYSLSLMQELEDPNLKHFIARNPSMMALPFQTSHSQLRHYKSVPIKDLQKFNCLD